ncbi:nucleoside hydrolase [Corynebacterium sp. 3HC-13]|uniref:nucleoside hydrolase n=1 Tax=Corynebacterium poyangense TaxID=2684405 RepID=UPI001CCDE5CC|nr:nucleoside hydrolase [Corynebacterium poyangense]MBZ8177494.1 nucleoside hydrolase [Corynebacterium poyangense]
MTLAKPTPVLLDCDTGIDDALALIYLAGLHRAGRITLVGVSCSAGNTTAKQSAINTAFILQSCGLAEEEIPIRIGPRQPLAVPLCTTPETHGPTGLGYCHAPEPQPGVIPEDPDTWQHLWDETWGTYGQDLRLIITGPATALAQYLKRKPTVMPRTTMMGGAYLYRGNTTPTAEWNSWVDPHAAKEIFAPTSPFGSQRENSLITVCSLEVTEQFCCHPHHLEHLCQLLGSTPIARDLPDILRFYFEFHRAQGEGYLAQIHDLLTCMVALDAIPVSSIDTTVDVEADSPLLRGTTVADYRHHWGRPANARLITDVNLEQAYTHWWESASMLGSQVFFR